MEKKRIKKHFSWQQSSSASVAAYVGVCDCPWSCFILKYSNFATPGLWNGIPSNEVSLWRWAYSLDFTASRLFEVLVGILQVTANQWVGTTLLFCWPVVTNWEYLAMARLTMRLFRNNAIPKSLLRALLVCVALRLIILSASGLETLQGRN